MTAHQSCSSEYYYDYEENTIDEDIDISNP